MLPTSFPLPTFSITVSLRFFQICTAPSSSRNWMLMTLGRTFYDFTSWMMGPVLSWDYEELPWYQ